MSSCPFKLDQGAGNPRWIISSGVPASFTESALVPARGEYPPWMTSIDLLREHPDLGNRNRRKAAIAWTMRRLHGSHRRCPINSCLVLAVVAGRRRNNHGRGLEWSGRLLHRLWHGLLGAVSTAFQCGQRHAGAETRSAAGLLSEGHAHTRAEIRENMSGNQPLRRSAAQHRGCHRGRHGSAGRGRSGGRPNEPFRLHPSGYRLLMRIKALATLTSLQLAGGTNLVDLMKYDVETGLPGGHGQPAPTQGNIARRGRRPASSGLWSATLDLPCMEMTTSGRGIRLLQSAILAGASPRGYGMQPRPAETCCNGRGAIISTIHQRPATRDLGAGCSAIGGVNRIHAILGASDDCIAVHPRTCALPWP